MKNIKHLAFWPAAILVGGSVIFCVVDYDNFTVVFNTLNSLFLENFGWLANILTVASLAVCLWAMLSKFGQVRVGGKDAKPTLSNFSWFSISLTSTLATGLLVWGPSEPVYHLQDPASAITGFEPLSGDSALFAMETMFMHWSFLPYGIMTIAGVAFAFMYYNGKGSYSITTQLSPMLGKHNGEKVQSIVDALVLFAITIAISASLGTSLLNINDGIHATFGVETNAKTTLVIAVIFAVLFIGSAVLGLKKGIKVLADWNVYGYIVLLVGLLILGPTFYILNLGTEGFATFITHIFDRSMITGAAHDTQWSQWWTTFYWASYFAWTPTIGLFLGSISYGRKIKDVVAVNLFFSGGFGGIWVMILSGTSIQRQMHGIVDLVQVSVDKGMGAVPYEMLRSLPIGIVFMVLYLVIIIVSFVTSANANVSVMAGLASKNVSLEDPTGSPAWQKVLWGVIVSGLAYVIDVFYGINGLKALCNVAGLIAIFLQIGIVASVIILIKSWRKFDKTGTYLPEEPDNELM